MEKECCCYVDENYELHQCKKIDHPDHHHPLCVCGDKLDISIACGCHYCCVKCGMIIYNLGCFSQEKSMIDITVVLDKSGSMNSIKKETIEGYNSFLDRQKELGTEGHITLIQFSSDSYKKGERERISRASKLNSESYRPDGWTPLLDALGRSIKETGDRLRDMKHKPDKVLFVIITDGQENASKEYKRQDIWNMIDHQTKKYSWEFVYLGANQDSFAEAGAIGINYGSTMNFTCTKSMYDNVSTMVGRYSTTGTIGFTEEERLLQEEADKKSR